MDYLKDKFLNKEVKIYPNDTYYKRGIVRDISPLGVTFEITATNDTSHTVGALWFISTSAKLVFEELIK